MRSRAHHHLEIEVGGVLLRVREDLTRASAPTLSMDGEGLPPRFSACSWPVGGESMETRGEVTRTTMIGRPLSNAPERVETTRPIN